MSQNRLPMLHLHQESTKNWKFWEKPRTDVWQNEIRASEVVTSNFHNGVCFRSTRNPTGLVFEKKVRLTSLDEWLRACYGLVSIVGFWLGRFEFRRWISWFTQAHSRLLFILPFLNLSFLQLSIHLQTVDCCWSCRLLLLDYFNVVLFCAKRF